MHFGEVDAHLGTYVVQFPVSPGLVQLVRVMGKSYTYVGVSGELELLLPHAGFNTNRSKAVALMPFLCRMQLMVSSFFTNLPCSQVSRTSKSKPKHLVSI
jgi:hypothetical protein